MSTKLKRIAVSEGNYHTLKTLGMAGDSFNDVVTQLLKQKLQEPQSLDTQGLIAGTVKPIGGTNSASMEVIHNG